MVKEETSENCYLEGVVQSKGGDGTKEWHFKLQSTVEYALKRGSRDFQDTVRDQDAGRGRPELKGGDM